VGLDHLRAQNELLDDLAVRSARRNEMAIRYAHQSATFVPAARARSSWAADRAGRLHRHCFGPHLHFEVHLAGTWSAHERDVDPLKVLARQ
jgi:hypothetical protein